MAIQTLKWRPRGPVGFAPLIVAPDGRNAPGAFKFLTCVDQLSLENAIEYLEHVSKCSPLDALDFRQPKSIQSNLTITFSDFVTETMVAALLAELVAADVSPVSVSNEELPGGLVDGDSIQLGGPDPAQNITSLVITDSTTAGAQTLTEGTDYTFDPVFGYVTFPDVSGFVQPFIADYSKQNPQTLAGLKASPINRWVTFQGANSANAGKIVPVNLFNVSFSPASLDFLPDDLGALTMQASLLIDTSRPASDPLGQYYSVGLEE